MSNLIDKTPAALAWVKEALEENKSNIYSELVSAVLWTEQRNEAGDLIVPADPDVLVNKINSFPMIVLHNHDPGKPVGQVLRSAKFYSDAGQCFVVAILGYYSSKDCLNFDDLNLDADADWLSPSSLPELPDRAYIQVGADPRDVEREWLELASLDCPVKVEYVELSHNAAVSAQELITVALPFLILVWNPFVTAIATEAGTDTYHGMRVWLRNFLERLSDRRNPIVDIQSFQDGCEISFIIRGKCVKSHYAAHENMADAAVRAARLISSLKRRGMPPRKLVYEFDRDGSVWYPSYAILENNRIISRPSTLIAIEQLPKGLSLGLGRNEVPADRRRR